MPEPNAAAPSMVMMSSSRDVSGQGRFAVLVFLLIAKTALAALMNSERRLRGQRQLSLASTYRSSPLEDFAVKCKRALGYEDVTQIKYADFIRMYCQEFPGPSCVGDLSFVNLPEGMQLAFIKGNCADDQQVECLLSLLQGGNDFFYAGSVNVLCGSTYPLLKSKGLVDYATRSAISNGTTISRADTTIAGNISTTIEQVYNGAKLSPYKSPSTKQLSRPPSILDFTAAGTVSPSRLKGVNIPATSVKLLAKVSAKKGGKMSALTPSPSTESPMPTTSPMPTSAMPTSATPTSAMPTSAILTSAMPTSALPTSALPTSATPMSVMPTSAMVTSATPTRTIPTSATLSATDRAPSPEPSSSTWSPTTAGDGALENLSTPAPTLSVNASSGRGPSAIALSAIAGGLVVVVLASTQVRRRKKRRRRTKVPTTDPALHGDASISSERSSTFGYGNVGESSVGLSPIKPPSSRIFSTTGLQRSLTNSTPPVSPTPHETSMEQREDESVWLSESLKAIGIFFKRNRAFPRARSDSGGGGKFFPPSTPYLVEEYSVLKKTKDRIDEKNLSLSGRNDPHHKGDIVEEHIPVADDLIAHDCLQSPLMSKGPMRTDTLIYESDRLAWRSTLSQPFSDMILAKGKACLNDELPNDSSIGESDSTPYIPEVTSKNQIGRVGQFRSRRARSGNSGSSELKNESLVLWPIAFKDVSPKENVQNPINDGTAISEGTKRSIWEAMYSDDNVCESRPWRPRRSCHFSTVFGEQLDSNAKAPDARRRASTGDGRFDSTSDSTEHVSRTRRSVPLDDESLGSMAFISPDIIKQFQEVDQRLSDGFEQFREVDERISEEFASFEAMLDGRASATRYFVAADATAETFRIDAVSPDAITEDNIETIKQALTEASTGDALDGDRSGIENSREEEDISFPEPSTSSELPGVASGETEPPMAQTCVATSDTHDDTQIDDNDDDDSNSIEEEAEKYQFCHLRNHYASAWYQKPKEALATPPTEHMCDDFLASPLPSLLAPSATDDSSSSDEKEESGAANEDFGFNEVRGRFAKPAAKTAARKNRKK